MFVRLASCKSSTTRPTNPSRAPPQSPIPLPSRPFAQTLNEQVVDNKINKFRHVILEILHRLPNNEVLKPYNQELLLLVMSVVDSDNEDNAIQGLRVVFDLQKNYRPQLESEVPRFLQVKKWGVGD